jgi:hypothetical protein
MKEEEPEEVMNPSRDGSPIPHLFIFTFHPCFPSPLPSSFFPSHLISANCRRTSTGSNQYHHDTPISHTLLISFFLPGGDSGCKEEELDGGILDSGKRAVK